MRKRVVAIVLALDALLLFLTRLQSKDGGTEVCRTILCENSNVHSLRNTEDGSAQ